MEKEKTIHLKGLNGIRALAAIGVLVGHLELLTIAPWMVTVFFALSGFLITYLLLHEKEQTGTVHITKFYFRRALRIWPLYFLFIIIAVLASQKALDVNFLYYIFFSGNLALALKATYPYLAHYWSLGVEEQFYLFWPWVVRSSKTIIGGIITVFIFFFGLKILARFTIGGEHYLYELIYLSKFQCMAIGGMGAYYYYKNPTVPAWVNHWSLQLITWAYVLLVIIDKSTFISLIDNEILSIITTLMIIHQVSLDKPLVSLEGKIFNFLGKISFGIYIYHPVFVHFIVEYFKGLDNFASSLLLRGLCYSSCFAVTILVSYLSYEYFEKRFLKIKMQYMIVDSSPDGGKH